MGVSTPESCDSICLNLYDPETGFVPRRSVQRDLHQLVNAGLLARHGNTRSTRYNLSDGTHQELIDISIEYYRERTEFVKYKSYGIAPRFRFPNMDEAFSWMIRRSLLQVK